MNIFEWFIIFCLLGGSMYLMWEWTDRRHLDREARKRFLSLQAEIEAYLTRGKSSEE